VTGLFIDGQLGLVSFVAFLNFTAGVWIAQSIHSLGNARTDDSYNGIIAVLLDSTGENLSRARYRPTGPTPHVDCRA